MITGACSRKPEFPPTNTAQTPDVNQGSIITVRGPVSPKSLGAALVHEHILVDFRSFNDRSAAGYDRDDVVKVVFPYLNALKQSGFDALVECTPAYLGRDVRLLKTLADRTGLHILTCTGLYGAASDKFLPPNVCTDTPDQLAARWIDEYKHGIDGTQIRPGFIKIAVDPGRLSPVDRKLVYAAARTHLQTGLTIACHTADTQAALDVLKCVADNNVAPQALIIVHADSIPDPNIHFHLAQAGVWLEYDAVSRRPLAESVHLIKLMHTRGLSRQLLISQDAGWFEVGQPDGGNIRPYTFIAEQLVPALKAAGMGKPAIDKLFIDNPARAFTVRVRKR